MKVKLNIVQLLAIFLFVACLPHCFCLEKSKKVDLVVPSKERNIDETEIVRLAEYEQFTLPLNVRTISYDIEYSPTNNN
jgi:hypothetical protein